MVDFLLVSKGITSNKSRISIKTVLSVFIVILAISLPQLFHIVIGGASGIKWLPMYLPVLLAGLLMGPKYGAVVGTLSPLMSFAFTNVVLSAPMPNIAVLPFMMVELCVFGTVSGLFDKKVLDKDYFTFLGVILAEVCGRIVYLLSAFIVGLFTEKAIKVGTVVTRIKMGVPGLFLLLVAVPFIVLLIKHTLVKNDK